MSLAEREVWQPVAQLALTPYESVGSSPVSAISPKQVRYIKLGEGGRWEAECLDRSIIRIGFGSADVHRIEMCRSGAWAALQESFLAEGKSEGTATRFTNELRIFCEDDGTVLWLTFSGERLWWGFVPPGSPFDAHEDTQGIYRPIQGGWSSKDANGQDLTTDKLSGALTKVASYRGTSCRVDSAEYAVRRINGIERPEVERALRVQEQLKDSVVELMRLLTWRDFETLVDLYFTSSGWRRIGRLGGAQKTLDIDMMLPSTGERAWVQIKARTTASELREYETKVADLGYEKMFFVFHSSQGVMAPTDERVIVVGPEALAARVMDAGLVTWLVRKVS